MSAQTTIGSYDVAVNEWLVAHGIAFTIEHTGEREGFPGETEDRKRDGDKTRLMRHDTYVVKFVRARSDGYFSKHDLRPHTLDVPTFYQSAVHSQAQIERNRCTCSLRTMHRSECAANVCNAAVPTAYDVLSAITKSDPGTFADFCGEYGYDDDSRRAMDTYLSVQNEWVRVRAFFTVEELGELREIAS